MTLNEAIKNVVDAETRLEGAAPALAKAKERLTSAQADAAQAQEAEADAEAALNDSLDTLILAATAAKLPPPVAGA